MSAGANGALMLYPKEIRNYRDWLAVDLDLWRHYWFGMVNRGVMAQPYWWDEQWTISVQHTEADIDKHLAAFDDVAPALAKAQQERQAKTGSGRALAAWGADAPHPPHLFEPSVFVMRLNDASDAPETCSGPRRFGSAICSRRLQSECCAFIAANGGVTVWLWIISLILFFLAAGNCRHRVGAPLSRRRRSLSLGERSLRRLSRISFRLVLLDEQHALRADRDALFRRRLGVRAWPQPSGTR